MCLCLCRGLSVAAGVGVWVPASRMCVYVGVGVWDGGWVAVSVWVHI